MKVCIVGAGAMGSMYGALLIRSGVEVVFYDSWIEHIDQIRQNGLRLTGITGDFTVQAEAHSDPAKIPTCDLCIVQASTYQTEQAAHVAAQVLGDQGFCLTLQNGVGNIETLSAVLGKQRILGGLSYHSAAIIAPGHMDHTHAGPTWIGELDQAKSDRLTALKGLLTGAGFTPQIVDDIEGFIWGKFIHNCAINAVCAAGGLRVGEIMMYPSADAFQTKIIDEILAVIEAKGIRVPEVDPKSAIKAFCKIKFNRPSMLQHQQDKRRSEINALNAVVVSEGKRLGVPTPFNEALVMMIQTIDARNAEHATHANGTPDFDLMETQVNAVTKP